MQRKITGLFLNTKEKQKEALSDHQKIVGEQLKYDHKRLTEAKHTKDEHIRIGNEIQRLLQIKSTAMTQGLSIALQRVETQLKPLLLQYQLMYDKNDNFNRTFARV